MITVVAIESVVSECYVLIYEQISQSTQTVLIKNATFALVKTDNIRLSYISCYYRQLSPLPTRSRLTQIIYRHILHLH